MNPEELIGTSDVARRLGLSESMVRELAVAGRLPAVRTRIGRLFSVADVEAFMAERAARLAGRKAARAAEVTL